ncbi:apolipoprotein N-acyltransferase [Fimbriimonas ginsengisoli]|uniref:Apolipoprotein N-acyltransferase n=1 Tax=Fimbriimonas ginsengisoli Gsoil 348 TaxID=661478 RepID=A0A068NJ21_FIMGI|nr:apolipoprotein N-acyltransferase [Fimbriimonas ginsengisoli]AIE83462.1 apolipoprotein N-acyltransferase [Fimbriimonas ginsengisoli Gsoil 348]
MAAVARADDWRGRPWKQRFHRAWPCLASALLMLLAFPPFNLGPLVFVALVPWMLSLRQSSGREAWRSGYVFGFLYGLGQLFWVAQLVSRWVGSIAMGIIPWLIACSLYALYFGWAAVMMRHAWHRKWPWAIPLVWAGIEVIRSFIPTFAFPWGLLATPLWPFPGLIQQAHFGTIFLVSAWVALVNLIVALAALKSPYAVLQSYVATALAGLTISIMALSSHPASTPTPITIGQPGVDMAFGEPEKQIAALGRNITPIAEQAAKDGTSLLVLPEGISEAPTMPPSTVFRIPPGLPVIFGGRRGTGPTYQSAFSFDGKRWQHVDKTRLVVFGEFVPGRHLFPFLTQAFKMPDSDMEPGTEGVKAIDIAGMRVGPIICFEAMFPDVAYLQQVNGARLLTVIGIDDWYMDGNAPMQMRAASVWRAVETGLPLVRSMTLGYSFACDGHGQILAEAPLGKPMGLRVNMPIPRESTMFHAAPLFPLGFAVFTLAMPWLRPRKPRE